MTRVCEFCGSTYEIPSGKGGWHKRKYCYTCSPAQGSSNRSVAITKARGIRNEFIFAEAVKKFGGKCEFCGCDNFDALCFYPKDPTDVKFIIYRNGPWHPVNEYFEEASKCYLVCLNCRAKLKRKWR